MSNSSIIGILFCIAGLIISISLGQCRTDKIDKSNTARDNEIAQIQTALKTEREAREKNIAQLNERLTFVEQERANALAKLDTDKQAKTQKLTKDFESDPTGVAASIGKITGFKVVNPSDVK